MENASKALIIAGAILLSILIIALGIYVFNMARGVTDTKILDETEISTYNSQFTDYEGQCVGSGVQALISKCITNANSNSGDAQRLPDIKCAGTGISDYSHIAVTTTDQKIDDMGTLRTKIAPRHYYFVKFHYDATSGCIDGIGIGYTQADCDGIDLTDCAPQ